MTNEQWYIPTYPGDEQWEKMTKIIPEQEYIDKCVAYALDLGWVKEDRKESFINQYLKPIHKAYLEILEDLKKENLPEDEIKDIVRKLHYCLHATRRIGSTDPENIIKTIEDHLRNPKTEEVEYALLWFYDELRKILS